MAASSSVTSVGGILIITRVVRQDGGNALQRDAAPAPPAHAGPAEKDPGDADHQRRELQGLGVVQVAVGLLCVLFSLTAISHFLVAHVVFCGGVWFVACGWVTMGARRRTSATLMRVCLWSNAVAILLSLGGVAYLSWLLATRWPSTDVCGLRPDNQYEAWSRCVASLRLLNILVQGLRGLFLLLLLLQAAVCAAICVLTAKAIKTGSRYAPITSKQ
ncbi:uncharacterized protein LOC119136467 [Syngnathus acus]|uniref:uncharacterized protein LOC119136467 n=1 Tax=Syngnathus acus TaxID=161584 RepID=UPI0018862063|nr:uncharacterized protein LOC119136467 [Syngnathus acus]